MMSAAGAAGCDYYSVDAILAEETYVPVRLTHGCTGVGTVIDASSDRAELAPGARLDMPLWMVPHLAGRNMVQVGGWWGGGGDGCGVVLLLVGRAVVDWVGAGATSASLPDAFAAALHRHR